MRSLWALFLIVVSGLAPGLSARGEEPLTLDRALAIAMERNPRILAAAQEVAASKGRTLRLKAFSDPSLSFSDEGLSFRKDSARGEGIQLRRSSSPSSSRESGPSAAASAGSARSGRPSNSKGRASSSGRK